MAPGAMIEGGGNIPHRLRRNNGLRQPLVPLLLLLLLPLLLLPCASAFLHPHQPAPTTHTGRRQPPRPAAPSFTNGGGVASLVRQWSSPLQHSSSQASPGSSAVALQARKIAVAMIVSSRSICTSSSVD